MTVHLADAGLLDELAAHLRASGFLIVRLDRDAIEAHPLNSVSDRHDRRLLVEQLNRWQQAHPRGAAGYQLTASIGSRSCERSRRSSPLGA